MLYLRSIRQLPEVFAERRRDRYLTPSETEELGSRGPAARSAWLLGRLTVKRLAQRYLSDREGIWIPENGIRIGGGADGDGRCAPVEVTPDGPFGGPSLPPLTARLVTGESTALSAVERTRPGKRFAVALRRIDAGFPFFVDETLSSDELERLAELDPERLNGHVAATLALKDAASAALDLSGGADELRVEVGPIEYGEAVPLPFADEARSAPRLVGWVDLAAGHACAYVAAFDAGFVEREDDPLEAELTWMAGAP